MVKQLCRDGYQVRLDGKGHWEVRDAKGRFMARFPKTTADRRWRDKLFTSMRRREREYAQQDVSVA